MPEPLPVWRIKEHATCPRRNYFIDDYGGTRSLLYEVAIRRGEAVEEAGCLEEPVLVHSLHELAERVEEDYRHIWGEGPGNLPEGWVEAEAEALANRFDDFFHAAEELNGAEHGVTLSSDELRLKGRVDAVDSAGRPVLVKNGKPPSNGVWRSDRAQATAYALLLEERKGEDVDEAVVEYVSHHEIRTARVTPYHRRELLKTRDRVRRILRNRKLPSKKNEDLCPYCDYEDECRQEPSSLRERFFG